MATFGITVRVDYNFEIEAETKEQAEQIAWNEYAKRGVDVQILEIFVDNNDENEDEDEDQEEPDESWFDGDALASAGHGTDEDYGYYGDE